MPAAQDSKTSVRIWRFADLNRGFGDVRSQRAEQTITLGPPTSKFDPWRTRAICRAISAGTLYHPDRQAGGQGIIRVKASNEFKRGRRQAAPTEPQDDVGTARQRLGR
jgi:hypothetical protein